MFQVLLRGFFVHLLFRQTLAIEKENAVNASLKKLEESKELRKCCCNVWSGRDPPVSFPSVATTVLLQLISRLVDMLTCF